MPEAARKEEDMFAMNGKKRGQGILALILAGLMLLAMAPVSLAANPPAGTEDYASMHSYVSKTDDPSVYKVTMQVDVKQTPIRPPALVTFVLDGTASMNALDIDGISMARDEAVRQAVCSALDTLMGPGNENKDRTYVNVVLFGSYADKAISLTEWATRTGTGNQGPDDTSGLYKLPGIRYNAGSWPSYTTAVSTDDNTARKNGSVFVPLVNGDGDELNPVLAGLFNHSTAIAGLPTADQTLANAIKAVYFFGNTVAGTGTRFPLSNNGTWINPGVEMAYKDLAAEIAVQKSTVSTAEFERMGKTVMILADGDDSLQRSSQSWATALRLPYDSSPLATAPTLITNGVAGQANVTASASSPDEGLGANVWALVTGGTTPAADFSTTWFSGYTTMSTLGQHLAGMTIGIDETDTAALSALNYAGFATYYPTVSASKVNEEQYRRVNTLADANNFFNAFANASTASGGTESAVADIKLSKYYEVHQVAGKPLLETWSTEVGRNPTATYSGGAIDWDLDAPQNGTTYLVFYVKMADGLDQSMSYPLFDKAVLRYQMSLTGGSGISYTIDFPMAYISPGGGTVESESPTTVDLGTGDRGYTGKDGHQDNRENAKSTVEAMPYSADVKPLLKGVKASKAANGRTKVIAEVENGNLMRYQWQWKNAAGEWEDIFGATSSQYTLSAKFKAGETYELRCKITNPAGNVTLTEVIAVTATAANTAGKLQSK